MAVAVTILSVITLINLALLVGLIRRVAEHEVKVARLGDTAVGEGPAVGALIDNFQPVGSRRHSFRPEPDR